MVIHQHCLKQLCFICLDCENKKDGRRPRVFTVQDIYNMESATFPWLEFADNAVIPKKLIGKGIPFAEQCISCLKVVGTLRNPKGITYHHRHFSPSSRMI